MQYSKEKIKELKAGFNQLFIDVLVERFVEDHKRFKNLIKNTNITINDVYSAFRNEPDETDLYDDYNEFCGVACLNRLKMI